MTTPFDKPAQMGTRKREKERETERLRGTQRKTDRQTESSLGIQSKIVAHNRYTH